MSGLGLSRMAPTTGYKGGHVDLLAADLKNLKSEVLAAERC